MNKNIQVLNSLKKPATKKDIVDLRQATKIDLKREMDRLEKKLWGVEHRLDGRIDELYDEVMGMKKELKREILSSQDKILKELVNMRSDYQIIRGRYPIMRDQLENHENRIGKLETAHL